jgi:putative flippase GtrA
MERLGAVSPVSLRARAGRALRRPQNWVELVKFCVVGLGGYAINLAVYTALLRGAGLHYMPAAACSFVVAVTNNYAWNRLWTSASSSSRSSRSEPTSSSSASSSRSSSTR